MRKNDLITFLAAFVLSVSTAQGASFDYADLTALSHIEPIEEAAVRKLEYIVRNRVGSPSTQSFYMIKLANAYASMAKTLQLQAISKSDQSLQKRSKKYWEKAIERLIWVEKNLSQSVKMDRVLFDRAFYEQEIGNRPKALAIFERLLRQFPESPLRSETALILGDLYFEKKRHSDALKMFRVAAKETQEPRVKRYAEYKTAWVEFNRGDYSRAIDILISCAFEKDQSNQAQEFRTEAVQDLALFYSRAGRYAAGYQRLSEWLSEDERRQLLFDLISRAESNGVFPVVLELSEKYLADFKPDARYPALYEKLVQARISGNQSFHDEVVAWGKLLESDSDFSRNSPESLPAAKKGYQSLLLKQQRVFHAKAKKTQASQYWSSAEVLYQQYLRVFSDPKIRLQFADFLFDRKRSEEALVQYQAALPALEDLGSHRRALLQVLFIVQGQAYSTQPPSKEPKIRDALTEYSHLFMKKYPEDPKAKGVALTLASYLHESKQYDRAKGELRAIVSHQKDLSTVRRSWALLLDIFTQEKDLKRIVEFSNQALQERAVATDSDLQERIKTVRLQARFQLAEKTLRQKDMSGALTEFQALAKQVDSDPEMKRKAHWNSGLAAKSLKDYPQAIRHFGWVRSFSKGSDFVDRANQETLSLALEAGDLGSAHQAAVELVQACPSKIKEDCGQRWFNAAFLSLASGKKRAAKTFFRQALGAKVEMDQKWMFLAADLNEKAWLRRVIASGQDVPKRIVLSLAISDVKNRSVYLNALGETPLRKKIESQFQAKKIWLACEKKAKTLKKIRLKGRGQRRAKKLKAKLDLIEAIKEDVNQIVALQDPESSLRSLIGLVESYDHVIETIEDEPIPKSLNAEQVAIYQDQVNQKLAEFRAVREEYRQVGVDLVYEVQLSGDLAGYFVLDRQNLPQVVLEKPPLTQLKGLFAEAVKSGSDVVRLKILETQYAHGKVEWARFLIDQWKIAPEFATFLDFLSLQRKGDPFEIAGLVKEKRGELSREPRMQAYLDRLRPQPSTKKKDAA